MTTSPNGLRALERTPVDFKIGFFLELFQRHGCKEAEWATKVCPGIESDTYF